MEIAMVKFADSKYYLHSFVIGLSLALLISVYTRWRHYAGRHTRLIFNAGADDVNFNIA